MALSLSTLRKPINRQVIDPSTGLIREEWELYFNQLTAHINGAVSEISGAAAPAPVGAQYLVGSSDATLTAERVVTNSTTNTWDLTTPGQAEVRRAALTGDVTASANSNSTTIANDAVTYAKMQNVSATSRVLGRRSSGSGDVEECTLSEILDFIGSSAQGDILYRGASSWARLAASTSAQFLRTNGSGADPGYASCVTMSASQAASGLSVVEFPSLPPTLNRIVVNFIDLSLSGTDHFLVQVGDSSGYRTTGFASCGGVNTGAGVATVTSTAGHVVHGLLATRALTGSLILSRIDATWISSHSFGDFASADTYQGGGGSPSLTTSLDRVRVVPSGANTFDGGVINIHYE